MAFRRPPPRGGGARAAAEQGSRGQGKSEEGDRSAGGMDFGGREDDCRRAERRGPGGGGGPEEGRRAAGCRCSFRISMGLCGGRFLTTNRLRAPTRLSGTPSRFCRTAEAPGAGLVRVQEIGRWPAGALALPAGMARVPPPPHPPWPPCGGDPPEHPPPPPPAPLHTAPADEVCHQKEGDGRPHIALVRPECLRDAGNCTRARAP